MVCLLCVLLLWLSLKFVCFVCWLRLVLVIVARGSSVDWFLVIGLFALLYLLLVVAISCWWLVD